MENTGPTQKASYDFYLILATAVVLAIISAICIYGMFYFKHAQIQNMQPLFKAQYMNSMNEVVSPFIICLILLIGICVPKRLLPTTILNWFTLALVVLLGVVSFYYGIITALKINLMVALAAQFAVLCLALIGNQYLHFEKKGYWVRVGSSAMHLGIILFILDLFYYKNQTLHLTLFWVTTVSTVIGMLGCFYSESIVNCIKKIRS
nr:hypothetical protein [Desulfobulbaceae bacterium]